MIFPQAGRKNRADESMPRVERFGAECVQFINTNRGMHVAVCLHNS